MYTSLRTPDALDGQEMTLVGGPLRWLRVSRNVFYLGITSMLTDISSEMVTAVLPLYLVIQLGLGPVAYGFVAGGYVAVTAIGRLTGGALGDRAGGHKRIAVVGYGISAVCKLGVLLSGGVAWIISSVLYVDRIGKGVRTTPRDALISMSSEPERLGEAFGVHRALDTAGAVLGPVIAFGVLLIFPGNFTPIFGISLVFATAGVAALIVLVRNPAKKNDAAPPTERFRARDALHLVGIRPLILVAAFLGVATISDGFIYLAFRNRTLIDDTYFPLLYVGTSAAYLLLALPAGRLADRIGRVRVLLGGYVALFAVYVLLLLPVVSIPVVVVALVCFGAFYAATDGVLAALTSSLVPESHRGSGLALVTSAATVAQFAASAMFGILWAWQGSDFAVRVFGFVLLLAMVSAVVVLPRQMAAAP